MVVDAIRAPRIDGLRGFAGGLVGYFGYETVRALSNRAWFRPSPMPMLSGVSEILLLDADELAVFDNLAGRLYLIVKADPCAPEAFEGPAERRLDQLSHRAPAHRLSAASQSAGAERGRLPLRGSSTRISKRAVQQIKDYILAGDVMQVVLSPAHERGSGSPPAGCLSRAAQR